MEISNFQNDLDYSNRKGMGMIWLERHRKYFNDQGIVVLKDSTSTNGNDYGVDMVVYVPSHGRGYNMEHKEHRDKGYTDDKIFLEFEHQSDNGQLQPGWIADTSKKTDILAYHKQGINQTFYFVWKKIRRTWLHKEFDWKREFETKETRNTSWVTRSLLISAAEIEGQIKWIGNNEDAVAPLEVLEYFEEIAKETEESVSYFT
jgi:hypothetical protein